jgi:transposase InsO family protein
MRAPRIDRKIFGADCWKRDQFCRKLQFLAAETDPAPVMNTLSDKTEFPTRERLFSLTEVAVILEDRRYHRNHERPHGSLSNKPPVPKSTVALSPETSNATPRNSR